MRTDLQSVLLPVLLSSLAFAQEASAFVLTTNDGDTLNAEVIELKGEKVRLRVSFLGGSAIVTRRVADFTPASVFRIEQHARQPSDFEGHFALAKRAGELRLLQQAGSAARAAIESVADPVEREARNKEVQAWAADTLETMTREAVGNGRLNDARHCLKLLSTRLADQRSEEQLAALAGQVEALEDRLASDRAAARQARLDAAARQRVERTLDQVRAQLDRGDKLFREAVRKSRSTVQSTNLCARAVDAYKSGWNRLQALLEKADDDDALEAEMAPLSQRLHEGAIRAGLHAANMLTVQSNYKGAMDWANRILAFDPDNAEAKEMVRTIQIAQAAASSQWGWGWTIGGTALPRTDPRRN